MEKAEGWPPNALNEMGRISGFTHEFYRYPATTSPRLVREILLAFTQPGDHVLDPFMGGGTTIVEALAHGRTATGIDINSLALTICRAKTTPLSNREWAEIEQWATDRPFRYAGTVRSDPRGGNLPEDLRLAFERGLASVGSLQSSPQRTLARCALMAVGKRAIDVPAGGGEGRLHEALVEKTSAMRDGMRDLELSASVHGVSRTRIAKHRSLVRSDASQAELAKLRKARLVLTSPPYPGVHVLYHRWQVNGRRETATPYWLARRRDGAGPSFYTMGGRSQMGQGTYFKRLRATYEAIRPNLTDDAAVVQIVGFHDMSSQLPRFLETMEAAGYREDYTRGLAQRQVPNRRWYTVARQNDAATEVLLCHRKRP